MSDCLSMIPTLNNTGYAYSSFNEGEDQERLDLSISAIALMIKSFGRIAPYIALSADRSFVAQPNQAPCQK